MTKEERDKQAQEELEEVQRRLAGELVEWFTEGAKKAWLEIVPAIRARHPEVFYEVMIQFLKTAYAEGFLAAMRWLAEKPDDVSLEGFLADIDEFPDWLKGLNVLVREIEIEDGNRAAFKCPRCDQTSIFTEEQQKGLSCSHCGFAFSASVVFV